MFRDAWGWRGSVALLLIDDVQQRLTVDEAADVFLNRADHAGAIFIRTSGDVRGDDRVVELPEGMAWGKGFGVGDVDAGASEFLRIKRFDQAGHIVDSAAADGDEVAVLLHQVELLGPHHFVALLGMRSGNENDVGLRDNFIDLVRLHGLGDERGVGDIFGIDADDVHAEGPGAKGDLAADAAAADDNAGAAAEFDAGIGTGLPGFRGAVAKKGVDAAAEGEEQGHGMVGDFRALDDLVVGEDDVRVLEIIAAGFVEDGFDAGAHDLSPLQVLAGANVFGFDSADEGVGIGEFLHDVGRRDGNDFGFVGDPLEGRKHVALAHEEDLLLLGEGGGGKAESN